MTYADIVFDLINKDDRYMIMTSENRAAFRDLPPLIKNNFIDTELQNKRKLEWLPDLLCGRIPIVHACNFYNYAPEFIAYRCWNWQSTCENSRSCTDFYLTATVQPIKLSKMFQSCAVFRM